MSLRSKEQGLYGRVVNKFGSRVGAIIIMSNPSSEEYAYYIQSVGAVMKVLRTARGGERIEVYATGDEMRGLAKTFIERTLGEELEDGE